MIKQPINENNYVQVDQLCSAKVHLKIEGLNPAGSIKLKTAHAIVADLESRGLITPSTRLIESSSGNLGVALAMVCAAKGYQFVCVIDPNTSAPNRKLIQALGAQVIVVDQRDENGGFLYSRIRLIEQMVAQNPDYIWLNQYQNPNNPLAHYNATARAIAEKFGHVDYLFVGAGTTGTLMGCKRYFADHHPHTKVIAVDSVGSVTFACPVAPAISRGWAPAAARKSTSPAISTLPHRARGAHGAGVPLAGAALWPAVRWFHRHGAGRRAAVGSADPPGRCGGGDLPDMGERYLETLYSDDWVSQRLGPDALQPLFPEFPLSLTA
jgi:cysteine synthase A